MRGVTTLLPANWAPNESAERLETERGSIVVWRIAPHIFATEVTGHLTTEMGDLLIKCGDPLYAQGMVHGFHNWLAMSNYDSACRIKLTEWAFPKRASTRHYVAVRSSLVAMGVSVANLALGNVVKAYTDLESMCKVLQELQGAS